MTTSKIMEQAQVFASSWALVGSRFDSGFEIANAPEQKPYGWMVQGVPNVMRGSLAQEIQTHEAKRIGGTCRAFPVYTQPAAELADDEIRAIQFSDPVYLTNSCIAFARAVLAAQKAKSWVI